MTDFDSRRMKLDLTTTKFDVALGAALIASEAPLQQRGFLAGLSEHQIEALPFLFEFWAMEHQLPPKGDWRTWVILGGRGAGKTRAGAEWVRSMVEGPTPLSAGKASRLALLGDTFDQVREVMIMGDSGILNLCPKDRRPDWISTRKMLVWPNGAVAHAHSAQDPERLRGPQFDAAWVDELAKWRKAEDVWDMLQFGLRLGEHPRVCVTTTPRNVALLRALLERENTVSTHATTFANAANLAPGFLDEMVARFEGTRLGRQELEGLLLTDTQGALWTSEMIAAAQARDIPPLDRIVVAVDPPVTSGPKADECGIVVAGAVTKGPAHKWKAYVLEDATIAGASPLTWAQHAVAVFERHGADRLLAEVNQGGEMVETLIRQVDPMISFQALHASVSKGGRAEPVAALYEQGRVEHVTGLGKLEDQMCQMTAQGYEGNGSPDRLDALVWALKALLLDRKPPTAGNARIRSLYPNG